MSEVVAVRRFVVLATGVLMVLALVACGGDSDEGSNAGGAATSADSPATDMSVTERPGSDGAASGGDTDGATSADSDKARDGGDGATSGDDTSALSEEQRVTRTVEGMYADLAAGDAAGVCAAMSAKARTQIAQQVPGGTADAPAQRTCAKSLDRFLDVASRSGALSSTLGATVRSVTINNGVATVDVSFKGSPGGRIRLTQEDGEWRFGPGAVTG